MNNTMVHFLRLFAPSDDLFTNHIRLMPVVNPLFQKFLKKQAEGDLSPYHAKHANTNLPPERIVGKCFPQQWTSGLGTEIGAQKQNWRNSCLSI